MRVVWLTALAFCVQTAAEASPKPIVERELLSEYRARRTNLSKSLQDGVIVLFGGTEKESGDLRTGFFQDPNFYYLSGWREPGAVLLLAASREILFLPAPTPNREKYTGKKLDASHPEARDLTGFEQVLPAARLESELRSALETYTRIYTLGEEAISRLKALAPLREVASASNALARLRMKKSPQELQLLQRAIDATVDAHRAAWKRMAPGLFEYQVAATMLASYLETGCERSGYPPIVGSGPNSVVLHYSRNARRMDRGEVLLMDVGAECAGYVADITRTAPVDGKFSKRQGEIYEIVLGAQKAAIESVKPGVKMDDLNKIAKDYINSHGQDQRGEPLGKYFTHSIGHHLGLEVHDLSINTESLAEGMVITIEPGIYIPEENLGIRIEDVVLVTADGHKVLSAALPRAARDIEKAIRQ
jgi:Xaa-Pro aminopeptidase